MSLVNSQLFYTIVEQLNHHFLENQQPPLSSTEVLVLEGIWQDQTYNEIASESGYSAGYFSNVVAPRLWRRIGDVIGKRVNKKNCKNLLELYYTETSVFQNESNSPLPAPSAPPPKSPSYPSGAVPLDSPFYIKRSPLEEETYTAITQPGALLRIKAPQEMGKTSLLIRTLKYGSSLGYYTVNLNLQQADYEILSNLNRFLRWICANISYELNIENQLDEYWDEDIGSSVSSTLYLHYILEQLNAPLIVAFDEVNQVFEYPKIAKSFLPLLRSWYEESKESSLWQKLRLVVTHSTEVYVPLQLNQSPFSNVGFPIELPGFSPEQVQELAKRYGLSWGEEEVKQLMSVINGHPALVHLTLYQVSQRKASLSELLKDASTLSGIYASHLQRHQSRLQEQPELADALHGIVNADEPVSVEPILAYKLYSMGLINLEGNRAFPRVPIYQDYFKRKLKTE
jgi:hypothetical protein